MSRSAVCRRSRPGLFPGQPLRKLYDCTVRVLRIWRYSHCIENAYMDGSERSRSMLPRTPRSTQGSPTAHVPAA